jgi:hypothetical protein
MITTFKLAHYVAHGSRRIRDNDCILQIRPERRQIVRDEIAKTGVQPAADGASGAPVSRQCRDHHRR